MTKTLMMVLVTATMVLAVACTSSDELTTVEGSETDLSPSASPDPEASEIASAIPAPATRPAAPSADTVNPPTVQENSASDPGLTATPLPAEEIPPTPTRGAIVWEAAVDGWGDCIAYEDGTMDCSEQAFTHDWHACGQHPSLCFEGGPDE
ncbi:MAG: hypothetical protein ACR2HR_11220 [Euzebya sp.]